MSRSHKIIGNSQEQVPGEQTLTTVLEINANYSKLGTVNIVHRIRSEST